MHSKLLHDNGTRTFLLIFERGDEATEGLLAFADEHDVESAHFTALGALEGATIGYFDPEEKEYEKIAVDQQVEVLAMVGNLARQEGKPKLHTHVVLGRRDGTTRGGHVFEAHVRPTLEVTLTETPTRVERAIDEASGLALLQP